MKIYHLLFVLLVGTGLKMTGQSYSISSVPFTDVSLQDSFWVPKLDINREVTLPYDLNKYEAETVGSDLFKVMEGASYILHKKKTQRWKHTSIS